ncbi:MAG TPA: 50S ribosomal protein L23 [Polyangiaceae bacterium]|nr:50S ribosomal protein L23 [Polyangiaceae bacterium]
MSELSRIIKRPVALTEKASRLKAENNQVVFEVDRSANKIQIRSAVEQMFGVKVLSVNTLLQRGKVKRMGRGFGKRQNWKKAIVTLRAGDDVSFFNEASEE